MRAMKDSEVDWIGEIPIQWQLVPTKRVFKGKKQIAGANSEMYERLALTMNGVVKRNKDDNEGLQPEQFDSYQILESNELVFKLIDLQNIRTSRVGLSPYTGIVSPAYIILTNTKSDNRFYYYWYFDMYNRCVFHRMGGDGVRSALNLKDVLEIPIPMISDAEQQRIAEFLDRKCAEVDEMIALQEQIIEELKAYKQSVITEAVTKGLNPAAPMRDSGIEWIGSIPEHWEVKRGKFMFQILSGAPFESELFTNDSNYMPLIRIRDIMHEDTEAYYMGAYTQEYIVSKGDILVGMDGDFNVASWKGKNALLNQRVCKLYNFKSDIHPRFIYYTLPLLLKRKNDLTYATTVKHLSTFDILAFPFTIPPITEQQAIADYLDEKCADIDSLIQTKQSKIDSLKEYKKSIIYEYVTGKREVE